MFEQKSQTNSAVRITYYEYNGLFQVVKRFNPNGSCLNYHYDGERNLIGLTNENGEQYRLDYDLNERLVQEVGFDGRVQRYNYNAAGHLQSAQDFARNGRDLINQIDFVRRADGRVTQQIDSLSGSTLNEFDYDANGRITLAKKMQRANCAGVTTPWAESSKTGRANKQFVTATTLPTSAHKPNCQVASK